MAVRIVLKLDEYGKIIVEPVPAPHVPTEEDEKGLVKAGIRDKVKKTIRWVRIKAKEVLTLPLVGLGKLFMATLPESRPNDQWQVDEFSVEFELGLEVQVGAQASGQAGMQAGTQAAVQGEAQLVICPNRGFKCAFIWRRRPEPFTAQA